MTANLRPMNLGEILDRTFQIYRAKFLAFARIAALPALAMLLVRLANEFFWKFRPPDLARLFFVVNLGWLLFGLVNFHILSFFRLLAFPSIVSLSSNVYLDGCTGSSSLFQGWIDRWKTNLSLVLVQLSIVLVLPEIVCFILAVGVSILEEAFHIDMSRSGTAFFPIATFFIIAGFVAYFWLSSCFSLCWPSSCCEGLSARQAIKRSRHLSRRGRYRLVALQLISAFLWWTMNFAGVFLARLLYLVLRMQGVSYLSLLRSYEFSIFLGKFAVDVILAPIFPIALTLFYYDQRIRHEGYDIERMMDAAGLNTPATPPSSEAPSAPAEAVEGQV